MCYSDEDPALITFNTQKCAGPSLTVLEEAGTHTGEAKYAD